MSTQNKIFTLANNSCIIFKAVLLNKIPGLYIKWCITPTFTNLNNCHVGVINNSKFKGAKVVWSLVP